MTTPTKTAADWSKLMIDTSLLCADASMVMALRSWRIMTGGAAGAREAERMWSEKVAASFELAGALASGRVRTPEAAARKTLSVYRRHVSGNRRRLG